MSGNTDQPANEAGPKAATGPTLPLAPPEIAILVEQNVKPIVTEAQRIAAETSVSGRHAVSRGRILLAFYAWLLSGALLFSFIARYTQFFPVIGQSLLYYRGSSIPGCVVSCSLSRKLVSPGCPFLSLSASRASSWHCDSG